MRSPAKTPREEPLIFTATRILVGAFIAYLGLTMGICPDDLLGYLKNSCHLPSFLSAPTGELFPWLVLGFGLLVLTRFKRLETAFLFCGLILISASLDKMGDPVHFSESVSNYKMLPSALVPLTAVVIPWLEFFTGLCLVLGYLPKGAALLFCLLMGVYALSLSWDLNLDVDLNCSCFSMACKEKMTWWTAIRDLIFLGVGLTVLTARDTPSMIASFFAPKTSK